MLRPSSALNVNLSAICANEKKRAAGNWIHWIAGISGIDPDPA